MSQRDVVLGSCSEVGADFPGNQTLTPLPGEGSGQTEASPKITQACLTDACLELYNYWSIVMKELYM